MEGKADRACLTVLTLTVWEVKDYFENLTFSETGWTQGVSYTVK